MIRNIARRSVPLLDAALSPVTAAAALWLRAIKGMGKRTSVSKRIFRAVGLHPLKNHYYEPFPQPVDSLSWQPRRLPGIDLNVPGQLALLAEFDYVEEIQAAFPLRPDSPLTYSFDDVNFQAGDAETLYNFVRHFQPRTLIEIGSGASTLVAAKALAANEDSATHICIEPYEEPWLEQLEGVRVLRSKVEDVDLTLFEGLTRNDILFIDSSHVIRTQGDVLHEYLEIIPRLQSGVLVHVHDVFTPREYLRAWIEAGILWNEQYVLEALLSCSDRFEVLCAANMLKHDFPEEFGRACPVLAGESSEDREPGSFWFRIR